MTATARLLTAAALDHFPEDDGRRYEIFDGELVVTAQPTTAHQRVAIRLATRLLRHVEERGLGEVFDGPTGARLAPRRIVSPDILFVRTGRQHIIGTAWIEGPPDLVVEILSPSTRARDLGRKKELYAGAGVPEYWIVDVEARAITVLVLIAGHYQPLMDRAWPRSRVLPGFVLDEAALCIGLD